MEDIKRRKEILKIRELGIEYGELVPKETVFGTPCYESIEFHLIIHMTDEEYYYMDRETLDNYLAICDESIITEGGVILAFR